MCMGVCVWGVYMCGCGYVCVDVWVCVGGVCVCVCVCEKKTDKHIDRHREKDRVNIILLLETGSENRLLKNKTDFSFEVITVQYVI